MKSRTVRLTISYIRYSKTDRKQLALQGMHACGWVHCDVSAGNILVFDEWAKIADLEYAAQKDERKKHDGVVRGTLLHCFVNLNDIEGHPVICGRRGPETSLSVQADGFRGSSRTPGTQSTNHVLRI